MKKVYSFLNYGAVNLFQLLVLCNFENKGPASDIKQFWCSATWVALLYFDTMPVLALLKVKCEIH